MSNISKIKREKMIAFLEDLKCKNDDEESIIALNAIEMHIKEKKYGLLWEEHEENVDLQMKNSIPIFNEDLSRKIEKNINDPYSFILEGDNLQSLYLLEKTHKGRIDCIYIDPPFNTGDKKWKYNNDYIDNNDEYLHSKWISMMNSRLKVAKKLLKDDGVLICAIDENELANLILLLEDVFDRAYKIDPIVIVHNPRGIQGDNFSYVNEYALFVYKKGYKVIEKQLLLDEEIYWSPLRNWGSESERYDAANCFYPIFIKDEQIIGFGDDVTNMTDFHPKQTEYIEEKDVYAIYPIDVQGIERKWRYARQSVDSIKDFLRVKKIEEGYDIEIGKNYAPYKTVWTDKKYDANEYGTQLINSMVPSNDFDFPKSIWNTYECLRSVTLNKPNAIILDFFAGSGTTGHATLLLNKLEGGERKFILCTNNDVGYKKEKEYEKKYGEIDFLSKTWENWSNQYGIATSVTYPRIKAAIDGYYHKKDFKESLYEHYITPSIIKNSKKILEKIDEICLQSEEKYSKHKVVVEDNKIILYGIISKGSFVPGLKCNVKYYKCGWTPRKPDDYLLTNLLCLHIKEMIELQNSIDLDNTNNILILNKNDYDKYIRNKNLDNVKNIWVNQGILFSADELIVLNKKGFKFIPREFFGEELKEVAE